MHSTCFPDQKRKSKLRVKIIMIGLPIMIKLKKTSAASKKMLLNVLY